MVEKEHGSYRPATLDDIGWITNVFLVSLRVPITESGATGTKRRSASNSRASSARGYTRDSERWHRGGFLPAWMAGDHLFLGTLCIHPAFQNRGLGAAAMRSIAQERTGRSGSPCSNQTGRRAGFTSDSAVDSSRCLRIMMLHLAANDAVAAPRLHT